MSSIAVDCIDDLVTKIKAVDAVSARVFHVYSEEELVERTKGLSYPCVGVVYVGLMGKDDPSKIGATADLVASIMVLFRQDTRATSDPKVNMVGVLDTLRSRIQYTKSPTGHYWRFQMEVSVPGKQGLLSYIQRWATAAPLPPK